MISKDSRIIVSIKMADTDVQVVSMMPKRKRKPTWKIREQARYAEEVRVLGAVKKVKEEGDEVASGGQKLCAKPGSSATQWVVQKQYVGLSAPAHMLPNVVLTDCLARRSPTRHLLNGRDWLEVAQVSASKVTDKTYEKDNKKFPASSKCVDTVPQKSINSSAVMKASDVRSSIDCSENVPQEHHATKASRKKVGQNVETGITIMPDTCEDAPKSDGELSCDQDIILLAEQGRVLATEKDSVLATKEDRDLATKEDRVLATKEDRDPTPEQNWAMETAAVGSCESQSALLVTHISGEGDLEFTEIKQEDSLGTPQVPTEVRIKEEHVDAPDISGLKGQQDGMCEICGLLLSIKDMRKHKLAHKASKAKERNCLCDICPARFKTNNELNHHKRMHSGERTERNVMCEICGQLLSIKNMRKHKLGHTNSKAKERNCLCDICPARFKTNNDLNRHKMMHTGERPFPCDRCDYRGTTKWELKKHYRRHIYARDKMMACPEEGCEFRCHIQSVLKKHMVKHTGDKPFTCHLCGNRFSRRDNLSDHLKRHAGETRLECSECDYRCIRSSDMKKHKRTHSGAKPYSCQVCGQKFAQQSHVKAHMVRHTNVRAYKCTECDYAAFLRDDLIKHIKRHSGERPFICQFCNYRCISKTYLTRHMRVHTPNGNPQKYKCVICPKKFARKMSLSEHIMKHSGELPFSCNVCSYRCISKRILKKHLEIHNIREGEKVFRCSICPHICKGKACHTRHVAQHMGPTPYQCKYCDFTCAKKTELLRHAPFHTKNRTFQCKNCGMTFTGRREMFRHKLLHSSCKRRQVTGYCCKACLVTFASRADLLKHKAQFPNHKLQRKMRMRKHANPSNPIAMTISMNADGERLSPAVETEQVMGMTDHQYFVVNDPSELVQGDAVSLDSADHLATDDHHYIVEVQSLSEDEILDEEKEYVVEVQMGPEDGESADAIKSLISETEKPETQYVLQIPSTDGSVFDPTVLASHDYVMVLGENQEVQQEQIDYTEMPGVGPTIRMESILRDRSIGAAAAPEDQVVSVETDAGTQYVMMIEDGQEVPAVSADSLQEAGEAQYVMVINDPATGEQRFVMTYEN